VSSRRNENLTVWGCGTFCGPDNHQWRLVAAVKSRAEFARLIGVSDRYVKNYASETGNAHEMAICLVTPHTLFGRHPEGVYYRKVMEYIDLSDWVKSREESRGSR
jgi:hypothetical protein